jgi:hypothetical protein
MKIIICTILLFACLSSVSQNINYLDVQDSLTNLSCGDIPLEDITRSRTNLEHFDPSCISTHKEEYYRNLGFAYYVSFAKTLDSTYIDQAITAYNNSIIIDSTAHNTMWDLSLCYLFSNQKDLGLQMLESYKNTVPRKYFQRKEYKRHKKYFQGKLKK